MKAMSIGRGLLPFATQFHVECLLASCFGMLRHTSSTLPLVLTMKSPHIDIARNLHLIYGLES